MIRRILIKQLLFGSFSRLSHRPLSYYSTPKKPSTMMKKGKDTSKNNKKPQPEEEKSSVPLSIYFKDGKTHIVIDAKPNSKSNAIAGISDDGVRVNIAAPPKEGEANKELLEYLAEVIGCRKADISLDKGSKSKSKIVVVDEMDAASVYEALKGQLE